MGIQLANSPKIRKQLVLPAAMTMLSTRNLKMQTDS
jgi:hypothetical protein